MFSHNYSRNMKKVKFTNNILLFLEKRFILIPITIIALCIMILSFGIISTVVTAKNTTSNYKMVTSVKIEKGDSLWSIANQYMTDEYSDINTYIEEIKKSNGLTTDTIHEDCYIIVPYYSTNKLVTKNN